MRPTHASSPHAPSLAPQDAPLFAVSLNAVIVAATPEEPRILVLCTEPGRLEALPAGPLTPHHPTLEAGLRAWVGQQTDPTLAMWNSSIPSEIGPALSQTAQRLLRGSQSPT